MIRVYFEKYRLAIGLILMFLIGLYIEETQNKEEEKFNAEIDNNLDTSIAKVKDKGRHFLSYTFYYEGKLYKDNSEEGSSSLIGRFFIVELSKKNPEFSRIRLDKEVKDSVQIAKSGFRKKTLDEILKMK